MVTKKFIVTGGKAYADIDVLACISAYAQLLNLNSVQARGVITCPWNLTIPPTIRKWPIDVDNIFVGLSEQCSFILVDISDPKFVEEFVLIENVVEVYDHHYGNEIFWQKKIPNGTHIEKIGACATLIWEKFKEYGLHACISKTNANLLYTAIFANTLNFKSATTSKRDLIASEELSAIITLPEDWKNSYYQEIEDGFGKDLSTHIKNDTKIVNLEGSSFYFGQIEVWNATSIVNNFLSKFNPHSSEEWFINIASIEEGKSYIYSNSRRLSDKLSRAIEIQCINPYFQVTPRLWLRKELLRELGS